MVGAHCAQFSCVATLFGACVCRHSYCTTSSLLILDFELEMVLECKLCAIATVMYLCSGKQVPTTVGRLGVQGVDCVSWLEGQIRACTQNMLIFRLKLEVTTPSLELKVIIYVAMSLASCLHGHWWYWLSSGSAASRMLLRPGLTNEWL